MLKRDRGTFSVKCNKLNYFFKYFISATLDVYKANHQIKKDRIIDSNAFRKERIAFKTIYSFPLYNLKDKSLMAKQTIAKDKILTSAMVVPVPDVRRKETVNCFIQDGSVHIEFSATALQNGYIGDEITLKREDGKALRGVVVRKNLVKIK
jgi:flagella basal body P-ring formation protein FlgA